MPRQGRLIAPVRPGGSNVRRRSTRWTVRHTCGLGRFDSGPLPEAPPDRRARVRTATWGWWHAMAASGARTRQRDVDAAPSALPPDRHRPRARRRIPALRLRARPRARPVRIGGQRGRRGDRGGRGLVLGGGRCSAVGSGRRPRLSPGSRRSTAEPVPGRRWHRVRHRAVAARAGPHSGLAGRRDLRGLPGRTGRSGRPAVPAPVHQLHQLRTALHRRRGPALRPADDDDGGPAAVRARAPPSTPIRPTDGSTPRPSPARTAGRP